MERNRLAMRFGIGLFAVLSVYGIGMLVVVLIGGDDAIALRLISGFASMFAGVLGFGTGYLLGSRDNGNGHEVTRRVEAENRATPEEE